MKNILTIEKGQFYNWKNGSIFYTKRGEGAPILLVHSLDPICCSKEWTNLIKKLEKDFETARKYLDEANKISLYVRYTDIETKQIEEKLINKNGERK